MIAIAPFGLPFGAFFVRAHQGRGLRAAAFFHASARCARVSHHLLLHVVVAREGRKISTTRNHAEPSGTASRVIHIGCA